MVQGTGQECLQTVQSAKASIAIPVTGTMPAAHEMSGMWQHTKKNKSEVLARMATVWKVCSVKIS